MTTSLCVLSVNIPQSRKGESWAWSSWRASVYRKRRGATGEMCSKNSVCGTCFWSRSQEVASCHYRWIFLVSVLHTLYRLAGLEAIPADTGWRRRWPWTSRRFITGLMKPWPMNLTRGSGSNRREPTQAHGKNMQTSRRMWKKSFEFILRVYPVKSPWFGMREELLGGKKSNNNNTNLERDWINS